MTALAMIAIAGLLYVAHEYGAPFSIFGYPDPALPDPAPQPEPEPPPAATHKPKYHRK
jgi:hypothetical protein